MKYMRFLFIFLIAILVGTKGAKALSCSNAVSKDLGLVASYVKVDYEVIDNSVVKELIIDDNKTTYIIPNFDFEISVYNITEEISVTIKDNVYNQEFTISESEADDGVYTFVNDDFGKIYNYTFTINSLNPNCYGEKIRTINFIKPMYNAYSGYAFCKTSSNYYCQKFTTKELGLNGSEDFLSKISVNNKKNIPELDDIAEEKNIGDYVKDNWILYISIIAGIIVIASALIVIIGRKNKTGWEL